MADEQDGLIPVTIPGYDKPVLFPQTMTKDEIEAATQRLYAEKHGGSSPTPKSSPTTKVEADAQSEHNVFTQPLSKSALSMMTGAAKQTVDMINPVNLIKGAAGVVTGANEEAPLRSAIDSFKNGHYTEAAGHYLAAGVPFVGPMIDSIGTHFGTGDPEEMGRALPESVALAEASPTVRGATGAAYDAAGRVAKHPATTAAASGIAGYMVGGWPKAFEYATGGGLLGKALNVLDRVAGGREADKPKMEPEPKPSAPKSSVGAGRTAPSTETDMRSGAPMPQEPVPFVMHVPDRGPVPPTRTGTGAETSAPTGPTSPKGNGFSMNVSADKPATTARPATARPAGPATTEPTKTTAPPSSAEASKAAEPPTTTTADRPPTKSKQRSKVDGLSEADIDSRAASRGVSRETIIAEEEAALRQRAERHIAKLQAANAQPTTVMAEIMKYREKFGADFAKGK